MNSKQLLFLRAVVPAAMASMQATGVPASVTVAQAILESGWGQTSIAIEANNYFGIKAKPGEDYREFLTHEVVNGVSVPETDKFAAYKSATDSFTAHAVLLSGLPRYAPAMAAKADPEAFCQQLQQCGYSTNPQYAARLIQLIDQFDLTQYDRAPAQS